MATYVCPSCGKSDKIGPTDLWDKSDNIHRCGHCRNEWKNPMTLEQYEEKKYYQEKNAERLGIQK